MKFTIAIEPAEETAFGVVVPDLPSCFGAGDTVEKAIDSARRAIEAHCEALAAAGKKLPQPKSITEWRAEKGYMGWTLSVVDVPVERLFASKTIGSG